MTSHRTTRSTRATFDGLDQKRKPLALAENADAARSYYKVGLSGSGLKLSSVSEGAHSTSSYRMTLSPSGEVEVKYTLRF